MRLLFYFHGFNSAIPADWSDNEKIVAVEDFARDSGYRFLPTTVNYRRAQQEAREILAQPELAAPGRGSASQVLFSGSSMVEFDAPRPFFVYVDKGDEVIAWSHSEKRHAPIAHFRSFEGGSHSFEHAREALVDFVAARSRSSGVLEARRTSW